MGKLLAVFIFLKGRLREPSTFASIASVLALVGYKLDPGIVQDWLNTGTVVFGALGFFIKESSAITKVQ
jgi:hypothetical protein